MAAHSGTSEQTTHPGKAHARLTTGDHQANSEDLDVDLAECHVDTTSQKGTPSATWTSELERNGGGHLLHERASRMSYVRSAGHNHRMTDTNKDRIQCLLVGPSLQINQPTVLTRARDHTTVDTDHIRAFAGAHGPSVKPKFSIKKQKTDLAHVRQPG